MKCNDEISIGEYVRTISGNIDKVDALYGMIEDTIHLENHKWQSIKNIVKHSKNIIDLIEVGDYVNGSKVIDIAQGKTKAVYIESQEQKFALIPIVEKQIKLIVTKEQIKQIEYIIKE